ncbi:MAG: MBL fold metallo-hydrolase [Acidobacteriota bacterium]|nr:MBL fold metallo-hydrolase [Acidobacteriota bacterium]
MRLELVVLGSGSRGNATLVRGAGAAILIDAGISARQIAARLEGVGQSPGRLDAILLTHEHGDHVAGLAGLTRRFPTTVFANAATLAAVDGRLGDRTTCETFECGKLFSIGPFDVRAFQVPHDAADPVGFVIETRGRRFGFATDLGHVTDSISEELSDCDALVFEANHDREMLRDGPYPWFTKQRVASELGHLSNEHAAAELTRIVSERTSQLVLAHLSATNNDPGLACATVAGALRSAGPGAPSVVAASQSEPLGPLAW